MIELKSLIKVNPSCICNRDLFIGIMKDLYPSEKRMTMLLAIAVESGIAKQISETTEISAITANKYRMTLEEEYGVSSENAILIIKSWANAYGIRYEESEIEGGGDNKKHPSELKNEEHSVSNIKHSDNNTDDAKPEKKRTSKIRFIAEVVGGVVLVVGIAIIIINIVVKKSSNNNVVQEENKTSVGNVSNDYGTQTDNTVQVLIDKATEEMNLGEYEQAISTLNQISDADGKESQIISIRNSCENALIKEIRTEAESLISEGKYVDAIVLVKANRTKYDTDNYKNSYSSVDDYVQSAYVTSIEEELVAYEAAKDWRGAIGVVNDALAYYSSDSTLMFLKNDYTQKIRDIRIGEITSEAISYASAGDYISAMDTIDKGRSEIGNDADIDALYSEYQKAYKDNVLDSINSTYNVGGIDAVVAMLRQAQPYCTGTEISDAIGLWNSRNYTVSLRKRDEFYMTNGIYFLNRDAYDNKGNLRPDTLVASRDDAYIEYDISDVGAYKLRGTVYVSKDASVAFSNDSIYEDACVKIYGDDVLLYTSSAVSQKAEPSDFCIDVSGVTYLKIVMRGNKYSSEKMNTVSLVCLSDLTLGW